MNKTNFLLLLAVALLGALSWSTWSAEQGATATAATEESSSAYRRYVVDIPRVGSVPKLDAVQGMRLVPPRIDEAADLDGPANLERETLEGELARVIWDLVPPTRRAQIHAGASDPDWNSLKVAPTLRALFDRNAGIVTDAQKILRGPGAVSWCETEAYAADPAVREFRPMFQDQKLVQVPFSRLFLVGVSSLNSVEQGVENLQRGRPAGDTSQLGFGELQTQSAQRLRDSLVSVIASTEAILAPWRRPLRHLERLLGGTPRHGFGGFDEEAWVREIDERVSALLDLARAEALDVPNPEEFERRRRVLLDALQNLKSKIAVWTERARAIGVERGELREMVAALSAEQRTLVTEPFPQGAQFGAILALSRANQASLDANVAAFLQRAKRFAEETLQPFFAELRVGAQTLDALPAEAEAMLRKAPRDVVLERGSDGAWRIASEGYFPASGERIDGVEITPAPTLGLDPLSGLRTLMQLAQSEISRSKLSMGGDRPENGPLPLLVALADLTANDPRGAWLPRERDYGFDENALEIVLEGEDGKVIERVRFGAPDAEAANPPPWIEGKRKSELTTRNMAYVHSFNAGRRLAYRVEWLPRVATARPNQALRAQDFLFGDRRLVPAATAENFASVAVYRDGQELVVARELSEDGTTTTWSLSSGDRSAAAMDEGLARRYLSQLPALFLEGVAAKLDASGEARTRFGFDAPRLRFVMQADAFREELICGARVRRDGKLYTACTVEGSGLGALTSGGRYAFLLEDGAYQRLVKAVDEVAEEARLLAAGTLLDAEFLSTVDRIILSEGNASGGPAPTLELQKIAGLWCLPAADQHPADPMRIEGSPKALFTRLQALQRAYPFANLTTAQSDELEKRLESGLRIALHAGNAEPHILHFVADTDPTLGGERLSNRRRSGSTFQIVQQTGDEEMYLVPALELPELVVNSWLDLQWQRPLQPIKQATSLRAEGLALEGATFAIDRKNAVWVYTAWLDGQERTADAALVDAALNWLETLGAIEIAVAPTEDAWLRVQWGIGDQTHELLLFQVMEGESRTFVARFPERAAHYRVSPLVIDELVAALKRLAAR